MNGRTLLQYRLDAKPSPTIPLNLFKYLEWRSIINSTQYQYEQFNQKFDEERY